MTIEAHKLLYMKRIGKASREMERPVSRNQYCVSNNPHPDATRRVFIAS